MPSKVYQLWFHVTKFLIATSSSSSLVHYSSSEMTFQGRCISPSKFSLELQCLFALCTYYIMLFTCEQTGKYKSSHKLPK